MKSDKEETRSPAKLYSRSTLNLNKNPDNSHTMAWNIKGAKNQGQFCQKCGCWKGVLGSEPTPELYIKHLVGIFEEVRRVLRKDGTCWINIGDSYNNTNGFCRSVNGWERNGRAGGSSDKKIIDGGILKPKDLCLIPFRLAIALQEAGWWVRNDLIWNKLNPMPSSVKDRFTVSHEYVFMCAKSQHYYFDQDAVREEHSRDWSNGKSGGSLTRKFKNYAGKYEGEMNMATDHRGDRLPEMNLLGRNKRSVWSIATQPFSMQLCKKCKTVYTGADYRKLPQRKVKKDDVEITKTACEKCKSEEDWLSHFACFPEKLVEPMILAGSPEKACPHCGAGWVRQFEKGDFLTARGGKPFEQQYCQKMHGISDLSGAGMTNADGFGSYRKKFIGWVAGCKCENNDGTGKAIILDPFAGSGTTCAVAAKLGRAYIGIEQQPNYIVLANKRISTTIQNSHKPNPQLTFLT